MRDSTEAAELRYDIEHSGGDEQLDLLVFKVLDNWRCPGIMDEASIRFDDWLSDQAGDSCDVEGQLMAIIRLSSVAPEDAGHDLKFFVAEQARKFVECEQAWLVEYYDI